MTILARLFLLVAIALVPVTAIQVFDESERRQTRETELNADALRLATLVGMEQDRIIEGARQLLITLSQLRSIRLHDRGMCDELFNRVTNQFPTYAHIVAADGRGTLICATDGAPRFDALQSAGSLSPAQSASDGFTIGDFWAAPDGTPSLQLRVPILDAFGNVDGTIIAGLRLDALISNVTTSILPPKAVLTITDRDGVILAHLPRDDSAATTVGAVLPQSRRALIHASQLGTIEGHDASGRTFVFGYNPVEVPPGDGVYIEVGLDRDSAFAAINRATAWHIAALIGALLVSCIMSWLGAHYFIHRPANDLLRAAGRWRDGDWSARVRSTEARSEFGRLGRAFDQMAEAIGERETQLLKAKDEAETASRVKSSFLANMSHELRTPLNAIIGFSEIITRQVHGPDAGARYRESATYINASGQHLLRLVNDILDLSKLAAAQVELAETLVDLRSLLANCVDIVLAQARQLTLRIATAAPDELPLVRVDELRLKQALLNLLANAVKFSRDSGAITLSAQLRETGDLAIAIADQGIGMKPEDIPLALEPFRQIDNALSRSHEGTGLGLPLAKMLVEKHGGTLVLESALGVGTVVTIILPRHRLHPRDAAAVPEMAAPDP